MFGPSEEVRRAQAAEAIGLKDIPASNDEYIILIKRQEVQGKSVDMERLIEQAKWRWTQSLSMKRRVKTRTGTDHDVELVPGLTRTQSSPRSTRNIHDRLRVEIDARTTTGRRRRMW